ncbi:hypothetical protein [Enterococcus sp. AD013-P3]
MMLEKLRKEWEKHFAKNHNLEELKNRPTNKMVSSFKKTAKLSKFGNIQM